VGQRERADALPGRTPGAFPRVAHGVRALTRVGATVLVTSLLAGCGIFGDDGEGQEVSVFDVEPRQCFTAMEEVEAELSTLNMVDCSDPHALEAYAQVTFEPPEGQPADTYPGNAGLRAFADASCAQEFADYVGRDYRDSTLFFTYLLPSPRSWQQGADRSIYCFITSAGEPMTRSARNADV
jgi:hypothetical protein